MDAFCAQFPAFVAWYTNIHGTSPVSTAASRHSDTSSPPRLQQQQPPTSPDAHQRWLEDQDQHDYDDPWRSHDLEYYEIETQHEPEYYPIETQPDAPEYYAPPTAASRQLDGPNAPWNKCMF